MDANAEHYSNDSTIEFAWAVRAQEEAELHYNIITSVDSGNLKLSVYDDRIYTEFRANFPDLNVGHICEEDLKSEEAKKIWRRFCNSFEDIENFNYGSLLRLDPLLDYTEENTVFVTRIQYLAIEIARNREGWSSKLYEEQAKERKLKKNYGSVNEGDETIKEEIASC